MGRAARFLRLPSEDRRLLVEALWQLALVRAGLAVLPFRTVLRYAERPRRPTSDARASVDRVAWALRVARRHVPGARCLAEGLAGKVLLARRGLPGDLRIGVGRDPRGRLEAHAWLEDRGIIVVGSRQPEHFRTLSTDRPDRGPGDGLPPR